MIECACGCGKVLTKYDSINRVRRFKNGHNSVGPNHYNWKGGRFTWSGYRLKLIQTNKYQREHRYVYERFYRCCLLPWTLIHHKNGDKLDNQIENLEPISREKHPNLHPRLKDKWNRFI